MLINHSLNVKIVSINVVYSEIEKINDIDYLTLLFAEKAIKEESPLKNLLLEYSKGENDTFKILKKRFEKNFNIQIEDFILLKEKILLSKKKMEKYIQKNSEREGIFYVSKMEKYFYKNIFYSKEELYDSIKSEYNEKNNRIFEKLDEEIKDEEREITLKFILNNELDKFNVLNLIDIDNKIIINDLIDNYNKGVKRFIPQSENRIFKNIKNWVKNLGEINRSFKSAEGPNIDLLNIEESLSDQKIEFDRKTNEIIFINFLYFKGAPFIKEERFDFLKFRESNTYENFLELLSKSRERKDPYFIKFFIKNSRWNNEAKVIKEKFSFKENYYFLFENIELMIKTNNDFFENDFLYIKQQYRKIFNSNNIERINYYKYISHFHPYEWNSFEISEIIFLFNKIYEFDKSYLSKEHLEKLNVYKNDKIKIYERIVAKFASHTGDREKIKENTELIRNAIENKTVDDNLLSIDGKINNNKHPIKNENIKIDYDEILEKFINECVKWRNTFNFYVHLNSSDYEKRNKKIESKMYYYDFLSVLKQKIIKYNENKIETLDFIISDINELDKIDEEFNTFERELNLFLEENKYKLNFANPVNSKNTK